MGVSSTILLDTRKRKTAFHNKKFRRWECPYDISVISERIEQANYQ